jgi:23S rRNA (pseudouridine1915-N3)-methyltransferase
VPKIALYSILKKGKDEFDEINRNYVKLISRFADVKDEFIFNKQIDRAQKEGGVVAKASYTEAFLPLMKGYSVILDPAGKEMTSEEFSRIFEENDHIAFFIGGAYGFDDTIRRKADRVISLSRLTMSHKLARSVLLEQIYRGLTIVNNHPYHK